MEVKYYVCNHCGNIIEMVKDKGVPVICCGEAMHELKAGVTDAAVEKHVPVYTVDKQHVHVVVGETKHPMLEEHFIEWIKYKSGYLQKAANSGTGAGSRFLSLRW
jgi:superoxide reductase